MSSLTYLNSADFGKDEVEMIDPTVVELRYKIEPEELTEFEKLVGETWSLPECEITVQRTPNGDYATVEMLKHFPTVDEARQVIERYLRSWEIDTALHNDRGSRIFRFDFRGQTLRDRNPASESEPSVHMSGTISLSASAVVQVTH